MLHLFLSILTLECYATGVNFLIAFSHEIFLSLLVSPFISHLLPLLSYRVIPWIDRIPYNCWREHLFSFSRADTDNWELKSRIVVVVLKKGQSSRRLVSGDIHCSVLSFSCAVIVETKTLNRFDPVHFLCSDWQSAPVFPPKRKREQWIWNKPEHPFFYISHHHSFSFTKTDI